MTTSGDPVDPEMEPDTTQTQEAAQGQEEEEDEDETDPVLLAKKQKQLAKRGVTFEAKVDPKVINRQKAIVYVGHLWHHDNSMRQVQSLLVNLCARRVPLRCYTGMQTVL